MKNRKLLSVGTPVKLGNLRTLLDTVADGLDTDDNECIVRHQNGQLIVERPEPTLVEQDPI